MTMYNDEMVKLLGEVYQGTLEAMNGAKHDPYEQTAGVFPLKCLLMLWPRVTPRNISKDLDGKMTQLMDMITPEEIGELMNKPLPQELYLQFELGKMEQKQKK